MSKFQYINISNIKKLVHEHNGRIQQDALRVLDDFVKEAVERAIRMCGHHRTIRPFEITFNGKSYQRSTNTNLR